MLFLFVPRKEPISVELYQFNLSGDRAVQDFTHVLMSYIVRLFYSPIFALSVLQWARKYRTFTWAIGAGAPLQRLLMCRRVNLLLFNCKSIHLHRWINYLKGRDSQLLALPKKKEILQTWFQTWINKSINEHSNNCFQNKRNPSLFPWRLKRKDSPGVVAASSAVLRA